MGLLSSFCQRRARQQDDVAAANSAPIQRPHPMNNHQRLSISLPEPADIGSSVGEELRLIKGAVSTSGKGWKTRRQTLKWHQWLAVFFPCFEWIIGYDWRKNLVWDLLAGCSVGFMVVPQGMSYAVLAGVPSVWGLYGAFIPVLMYSVFGSSRQLAVGPVAVTSLLIGNGIKRVVPGSQFISDPNNLDSFQLTVQKRYNRSVTQLAFLVSILYTAVGVLRLGFLIRFLSHPVTTGFTSGAAVIIGMSQVKYILGYNVPRKDTLHEQIIVLYENWIGFRYTEFAMGISLLIFLISLMIISKRVKKLFWISALGPMAAAVIGIIVVAVGKFNYLGAPIKVVLNIPKGLPGVTIKDWLPFQYVDTLVPLAFVVMLVDMLESTSIARALARKNDYKLSYNREIIGLGVANFFGAAFNAYTTTGSFSRSAVNNASGAKTQLAGVITAVIVMLVLLFLTPVFALVPYNAIGAIIIAGCTTLFEWRVAAMLWRTHFRDFLCWLIACAGVCFLGVEMGLGVSIALSLFLYILETAFPHLAVLGRVEKTDLAVSIKQYAGAAKEVPGVLTLRLDAPIYFGNVQYLEDKVDTFVEEAETSAREGKGAPLEFLILDLTPSGHIDSSGCHTIGVELAGRLQKKGIQVVLAGPSPKVLRNLERAGVIDEVGRDWVFSNVADAVDACVSVPKVIVDQTESNSGSDDLQLTVGKDVDAKV